MRSLAQPDAARSVDPELARISQRIRGTLPKKVRAMLPGRAARGAPDRLRVAR